MNKLRLLFLAPASVTMGVLFFIPLAIVCGYSLLTRGAYGGVTGPWTFDNYRRVIDPLYVAIVWRSIWLSGVSTLICLIAAFPMALVIAQSGKRKMLWLNLVMLPFWTSFLIRTYAWMFLLRDTGLINTVLLSFHLIRQPLPLLFNQGAVVLGLVYGYLPYMVLPLYATLEKLDGSLLDAAGDLGAGPWASFWRVIVPLAKPGVWAGCLLVFIPCLGAYLTPDLMGGGKTVMVGNLVQNQFTAARDWPFGAAVSLLLMALVLVVTWAIGRRSEALT